MDYKTRSKTYPGRNIIKGVELVLVFALILFGLDVLDKSFKTPAVENVQTQRIEAPIFEAPTVEEVEEVETQPMSAFDYFSIALDHQMRDEHREAIAYYNQSIAVDPHFASSYLNRGVAYEYLGSNCASHKDFWTWMTLNSSEIHSVRRLNDGETTRINMGEGRMFILPFYAEAGQRMSIQADSVVMGQVDPLIVVLSNTDRPLAGSDDTISNTGELLSMNSVINGYRIPETGTYALVVSHAGGGSYGDVDVTLNLN